ncbi:MAG: hypothetical protein JSS81_24780 [Acidobacteria bacterium]|nr:hypothetical protein [Acidobacteriota bacterium]
MNQQVNKDSEHLRLLAIFYYILAGLTLFPVLFGFIYLLFGILFGVVLSSVPQKAGEPPAALFGGIFAGVGFVLIAIFATLGLLILKAGRNLSKKTGYTFCFAIGCLICLWMPLGTILGVFTLIALSRDSVKALFDGRSFEQYGATPPNWQ